MRIAIFIAVALAVAIPAALQAQDTPPPRDWSWLAHGQLGREEILKRAGPPTREWKSVLVLGVLDMRPIRTYSGTGAYGFPLPRIVTDPKTQIEVQVLSYEDAGTPDSAQLLVLFQGRLVYSILPPLTDEASVAAVSEKMATEACSYKATFGDACVTTTHLVMEYPRDRIAWVCPTKSGAVLAPSQRVKWCGPKDFAPAFEVEWHIPEDPAPAPAAGGK